MDLSSYFTQLERVTSSRHDVHPCTKQILNAVLVICGKIKVGETATLIIPDITRTESNN